ncbi:MULTISPECIES: DUF3710 domain-containing protein [unclassified Streptomyces]|uniref:DUF3710 domain-containing protein n=1 Tax=unclassified Streptomyces TaxID=2593676 RepID=UPI0033D7C926
MNDEEIAHLLDAGQKISIEILKAGDPLFPAWRGTDTGPWDASEIDPAAGQVSRVDLGGLLIPADSTDEIRLVRSAGSIVAATVVRGPTGLQLQACRSDGSRTWEAVRGELRQTMRSRGAVVEEWAGDAGPELRALLPVTTAAGNADTQRVRMLGCDGPGWLLRGIIVSGAGAASESRSVWVYDKFLQAVVVSSVSGRAMRSIIARWMKASDGGAAW